MKPVEVADVDGVVARVAPDPTRPLVWFGVPIPDDRTHALVFDHVSARALGYALLSAADAARFRPEPKTQE